jgi:serine/threonine protein kinase
MTRATPTTSPILHGRYRIDEKLGAGRLAVVYRAYDERLQRPVLVHMLRKELLDKEPLRQRFIQEAHTSARRSHPSLLEVFDSGEVAGRPYLITEYVAGRTLRELGALTPEEALLYFRQVVGAVATCQVAGVPHPPVSSNNIILVEDGHVELVESWLLSPAEVALDNASYRAPERTEGRAATPASTVYALGLLLFEMLTGRRAIGGAEPRAVAQAHLTARIPMLREIRPTLYAPSLERLVQQATARHPEQRYPDAVALAQALDDLRREIGGDTQRLATPPVRTPSLRERLNRTAIGLVAPRRAPQPAPSYPPDVAPGMPGAAGRGTPSQSLRNRRRSISGIVILLSLLLAVACGAYYGASVVLDELARVELPRPALGLPAVPDLGIHLPEWLTGVVSGGGEVLVVDSAVGLRVRAAPGLQTAVIDVLPNGARVRKLEGPVEVDSVPWLRVRARVDGRIVEGWVSGNFVKPL